MTDREKMEEVSSILGSVIDELVPIHTTADAFEKGGVECRKFIETAYDRLLEVEQIINECDFDDNDELGAGYDEWRREYDEKQKEQST
jgi:hypothetical protein